RGRTFPICSSALYFFSWGTGMNSERISIRPTNLCPIRPPMNASSRPTDRGGFDADDVPRSGSAAQRIVAPGLHDDARRAGRPYRDLDGERDGVREDRAGIGG